MADRTAFSNGFLGFSSDTHIVQAVDVRILFGKMSDAVSGVLIIG